MALPPADGLASLSVPEKIRVLDLLFEPSTPLHALSLEAMNSRLATYEELVATVKAQLTVLADAGESSSTRTLDEILQAHPRLGQKHVDSAQSRAEQASLSQSGAGDGEAAQLAALNERYEARYPGLRYVVFVNGRPRRVIMEDMRERIANSTIEQERRLAIQAMCDIANDRAGKLLHAA